MALDIKKQIEILISKTKEGKIIWQQLNQNIVRWVVPNEGKQYVFTLQSTPIGIIVNNKPTLQYVLTIQVIHPSQLNQVLQQGGQPLPLQQILLQANNETLFQVQAHAQLNQDYLPLLQELFDIATEKNKKQAIDVLNELLGKL